VTLDIYNITGQLICRLLDDTFEPGSHAIVWDGRDDTGAGVASGIYLARLVSGGSQATTKMTLAK